MRLLDVQTLKLHTFYEPDIPPYAILSHTWLQDFEEVTYAQIQQENPEVYSDMPGYGKIEFLCLQAANDGLKWAWIDTACIDKANSAELSEAINSMFAWYRDAAMCYAYLTDIDYPRQGFQQSRWWTRAWTLQELLAPRNVQFYDKQATLIGSKAELASRISEEYGLPSNVLLDTGAIFSTSVAQRMSWASKRTATRTEDTAYSLLGIFDINMPLLYGEGQKAFQRLQREVLRRRRADHSLLAWGFTPQRIQELSSPFSNNSFVVDTTTRAINNTTELLASHPVLFQSCAKVIQYDRDALGSSIIEGKALEIPTIRVPQDANLPSTIRTQFGHLGDFKIGLLPCAYEDEPQWIIGILLAKWLDPDRYLRFPAGRDCGGRNVYTFLVHCNKAREWKLKRLWVERLDWVHQQSAMQRRQGIHRSIIVQARLQGYKMMGTLPQGWAWDAKESTLQRYFPEGQGPQFLVLGLWCQKERRFLCVSLRLTGAYSSIPEHIQSDHIQFSFRKIMEDEMEAVLEQVFEQGRARYSTLASDFHFKASITSRRIFNHVMSTLTLEKSYRGNDPRALPRVQARFRRRY